MALINQEKQLQTMLIDGEQKTVPKDSTLIDVVPSEVTSVQTIDGKLIPRDQFDNTPAPSIIGTNISDISKG